MYNTCPFPDALNVHNTLKKMVYTACIRSTYIHTFIQAEPKCLATLPTNLSHQISWWRSFLLHIVYMKKYSPPPPFAAFGGKENMEAFHRWYGVTTDITRKGNGRNREVARQRWSGIQARMQSYQSFLWHQQRHLITCKSFHIFLPICLQSCVTNQGRIPGYNTIPAIS